MIITYKHGKLIITNTVKPNSPFSEFLKRYYRMDKMTHYHDSLFFMRKERFWMRAFHRRITEDLKNTHLSCVFHRSSRILNWLPQIIVFLRWDCRQIHTVDIICLLSRFTCCICIAGDICRCWLLSNAYILTTFLIKTIFPSIFWYSTNMWYRCCMCFALTLSCFVVRYDSRWNS